MTKAQTKVPSLNAKSPRGSVAFSYINQLVAKDMAAIYKAFGVAEVNKTPNQKQRKAAKA